MQADPDDEMETLRQALDRLSARGFVDSLAASEGGLVGSPSHAHFRPEDLVVVEVVRFEGESDPGDEAIVFAVAAEDGTPLGTYTATYGADTSPEDTEVISHLAGRSPR